MIKTTRFLIGLIGLMAIILMTGCKPKSVHLPTMNPTELVIAQTKFAYQQQTKASLMTQTRVAISGIQLTPPLLDLSTGTAPIPSQTSEVPIIGPSLSPTPNSLTVTPGQMTPTLYTTMTLPANQSPTFTRTPTSGLTATPRPSTTTTQTSGWGGTWTAWLEQADGSYQTGILTVIVNGSDITGELTLGARKMTLVGKLYENDTVISGVFSLSPQSGRFYWKTLSSQQFGGNTENLLAFCAARQGSQKPDPCVIIVPS